MRRVTSAIKKRWYLYIVTTIFSIVLLVWIFSFFPKVKRIEIINLYIVSYGLDDSINEILNSDLPKNIKEIHTTHSNENGLYINYSFETSGALDSDIMILPYSLIKDYTLGDYFMNLSKGDYSIDYNYLEEDGLAYGIKIYDSSTDEGIFKDYILYGLDDDMNPQDYYLFINSNTKHSKNKEPLIDFIRNKIKDEN